MNRGRADRRRTQERQKDRARRLLNKWGISDPSPGHVGHIASTHGRPCDCWACVTPRFDRNDPRQAPIVEMQ